MEWMRPEAMLFDLDGTLFKTETLLIPAYHSTFDQLKEEGLFEGETPPEEAILGGLGMLLDQIWQRVMPGASERVRRRADELLLQYEMEWMKAGRGELYEGVADTLKQLREDGVRLFVASNGLEEYVKGVIQYFQLEPLFEPNGLYSAGEYKTASKNDLVRQLLDNHQVSSAWMVGDRSSDVEAGLVNGLKVIGCGYAGFGHKDELAGAHKVIRRFDELLNLYKDAER